jgi:transcriptional repressor NrdR
MRCPYCGNDEQKVLDSRPMSELDAIRRRRECSGCGRRFTTFERAERPRLFVVKRNGGRQEFDREKLVESMRLAARKRPVSAVALRTAADSIEKDLLNETVEEVASREVGARAMRALQGLDPVAYVRYASVYQEFDCMGDFAQMIAQAEHDESLAPLRSLQESLL